MSIRSLTDAIVKEDNIIGGVVRLGKNDTVDHSDMEVFKPVTGSGSNEDKRSYDIPETNIIDTLVHHDADIGDLENLDCVTIPYDNKKLNNNMTFVKTGKYKAIDKDEQGIIRTAEINSLTEAI